MWKALWVSRNGQIAEISYFHFAGEARSGFVVIGLIIRFWADEMHFPSWLYVTFSRWEEWIILNIWSFDLFEGTKVFTNDCDDNWGEPLKELFLLLNLSSFVPDPIESHFHLHHLINSSQWWVEWWEWKKKRELFWLMTSLLPPSLTHLTLSLSSLRPI